MLKRYNVKIEGRMMDKNKAKENRNHARLHDQLKFIGQDCLRNHGGERYVKSNSCVQCQKLVCKVHMKKLKDLREGSEKLLDSPRWSSGGIKFLL